MRITSGMDAEEYGCYLHIIFSLIKYLSIFNY
jgi:hypothetical protein